MQRLTKAEMGGYPTSDPLPDKEADSDALRRHTAAFLANGGHITKVGWAATGQNLTGKLPIGIRIAK